MWSLETGETLRTLVGHKRGIACVEFDGDWIVSGSSGQLSWFLMIR
jgi:WD40 repeat protein